MRFKSTRGGSYLSFDDAIRRGYPDDEGFFFPEGNADLRAAVYAPLAAFTDVVELAASELLPESLDPRHAGEIVRAAFALEPALHLLGEDILVLDLASGPTGSSADYAAAFSAAYLGYSRDASGEVVLAAAGHRDAAALAAAFSTGGRGLPLVLLCEEGSGAPLLQGAGAGGSPVIVLEVRGGRHAAAALERLMAGTRLAGRAVIAGGAATSVRLVGRCLLLVGLFSLARRGLSGDLIVAAPPGDLLGLVTGLWSWSWGLPLSAFLLPSLPDDLSTPFAPDPDTEAGAEFLGRFERDRALGSLVLRVPVSPPGAGADFLLDGLGLDRGTSLAAQAAKSALAAGLAGHGKIVVPRFADESWDSARHLPGVNRPSPGGLPPILIDPTADSLSAALSKLL